MATKTWYLVTDISAVWGVGHTAEEAMEDAKDWSPEFNADHPDVRVKGYRVARCDEEQNIDLGTRWLNNFSIPDDLAKALKAADSDGLIEV